jgi:hypothetical protein
MRAKIELQANIQTDTRTGYKPLKSEFKNHVQLNSCEKGGNFPQIHRAIMMFNMPNSKKENATMLFDRPRHNLLRITRMLSSLNQLGKTSCSQKLFSALENIYTEYPDKIPNDSFTYWKQTQQPINKITTI